MANSNLDLAVRIRADLQNALQGFNRLEQRLGDAGQAADKARGRMRRFATAVDGAVRGASVLGRHIRYLAAGLVGFQLARVVGDVVRNTGSSPLARGTRPRGPAAVPALRFIPARAGNTPGRASCRRRSSVHPRSRGEHRWKLASPGWLTVQRRSVGFVLALERFGDALTPVTFYRVKR